MLSRKKGLWGGMRKVFARREKSKFELLHQVLECEHKLLEEARQTLAVQLQKELPRVLRILGSQQILPLVKDIQSRNNSMRAKLEAAFGREGELTQYEQQEKLNEAKQAMQSTQLGGKEGENVRAFIKAMEGLVQYSASSSEVEKLSQDQQAVLKELQKDILSQAEEMDSLIIRFIKGLKVPQHITDAQKQELLSKSTQDQISEATPSQPRLGA